MNQERTMDELCPGCGASAKKKHTALIVGLCVGAAILTFFLFVAVLMIVNSARETVYNREESIGLSESDPDSYTVFRNKESSYVPTAEDDYYFEIVDAVREDLSYRVVWKEFELKNDAAQISASGVYPQLEGPILNLEEINAAIEEEVLYYKNQLEQYGQQQDHESADAQSACYVTYMDENILSIVLQEQITLGGAAAPELHAINIDIQNGRILDKTDLVDYTAELAQRVKKQNLAQNSGVDYISELSDDVVLEMLSEYEGIAFYTPVGLEVGFNYELDDFYGWVTVTLKEYSAVLNK